MKQTDERKDAILENLARENRVYVSELSAAFGVSDVTIRKDLKELEERGLLKRVHGGAERIRQSRAAVESTLDELMSRHMEEKRAIARAALPLIEDGDALILDTSTTTRELARLLRTSPLKDLTVITPTPQIALELCESEDIQVILIGGIIRRTLKTAMGPIATETLKGLHADKAFIGVNGIDPAVGLTTQNILECEVKRQIIASSTRTFVLADASKHNTIALGVIAPVSAVDGIVTDAGISRSFRSRLEETGADVIIADS